MVNIAAILALSQPPPRKMTLIALASLANEYGIARRSLLDLARMTGHAPKTVSAAIEALERLSYIMRNPIAETGPGKPMSYKIHGRFLSVV